MRDLTWWKKKWVGKRSRVRALFCFFSFSYLGLEKKSALTLDLKSDCFLNTAPPAEKRCYPRPFFFIFFGIFLKNKSELTLALMDFPP